MDVGELLNYKPSKEPKRNFAEDEGYDYEEAPPRPRSKRERLSIIPDSHVIEEIRPIKVRSAPVYKEEPPHLPETLDETAQSDALDDITLKKLLLAFEKRVLKNQELRIKFPDLPEKFMDSELELNDAIQELHIVATQPDLYHILVELNSVSTLLGLLSHDNTDISIAIVDLLQEMTDVDTLNESQEGASVLVDALLDAQVVALLVQNLERLDEAVKEESEGVHNTLAIIENLTEFKPEVCIEAAQQGLMQWILKRLKAKMPFDANKLYCSELLSVLLQNHDDNRKLFGESHGVDVLLQQLAYFKRHDPHDSEEQEMMENLFDCLCSVLMLPVNRDLFLKGEGLQLMNLMLREKKLSRNGALKVLDHAMSNFEGSDNCNKFVDILGLRSVFPLFMKTPKKNRKKTISVEEHEEHVSSIVCSMLKNCKGTQRQRLLNKFTENDHEKVDRLMELHFKYLDKVHLIDNQIEKEKAEIRYKDEEIDPEQEEEFYLRRLENGLFVLQLIDFIMLDTCSSGPPTLQTVAVKLMCLNVGCQIDLPVLPDADIKAHLLLHLARVLSREERNNFILLSACQKPRRQFALILGYMQNDKTFTAANIQIKQRVIQILNLRGGSIKTIRNVMREYAGNLGDAKDDVSKETEQQRILQLVDRF